ncbi:Retrovirus-related Pol polyprotein [Takifugu flavidus]|uniref:Retrovirus-related Pol polyprotein n=1 Tax=Takifugu flavidus TaxID=433684 RepID=A0A5C6NG29_9TELE|nr:Retrovirus-related Pol polyprotein [Takifugu flavidus]
MNKEAEAAAEEEVKVDREDDNSVDVGDHVWVKRIRRAKWSDPRWEGPFQILLKTPTAVRIAERSSWVLRGLAPSYLEELVTPYQPNRPLRSQNAGLLVVPRVSRGRMGGRAFSYSAPLLWNQLPVQTDKIS